MEIILGINTGLLLIGLCVYLTGKVTGRLMSKKGQQAIAPTTKKSVSSGHRLVKTYLAVGIDDWIDGWRFQCSCGSIGSSSGLRAATYKEGGSFGSEVQAIAKFKVHRDNFISANGPDDEEHEDTAKLRKLEAEFAEWRKACYCKDTNDDLLVLKHRHL